MSSLYWVSRTRCQHGSTCSIFCSVSLGGNYRRRKFIALAAFELTSPDRIDALIEPLRNVYGISDKVLAMALSDILIGAADVRPAWLDIGVQLIAV